MQKTNRLFVKLIKNETTSESIQSLIREWVWKKYKFIWDNFKLAVVI